ncbi:MAG: hypothetical protein L3J28_00225 [Candidatus Polarisedimenticolaceae bacterium]|nr:hypothetical protein [Candidatus Polarisedimenticolaceae bacterium]
MNKKTLNAALFVGAVFALPQTLYAASCCGGGASSSLILPKFSKAMVDISMAYERYDGYWNKEGDYVEDPPDSELSQWRLNIGYAHRLADRWQMSVVLPYVWNDSDYSGISSQTDGIGDASINLWYEAFDAIKCVWKVRKPADLIPAVYFGASLTVPTGISPYDDVENSFDVTGRGFYRLDANLLLDKTIYPWNSTLALSYGKYMERPVNQAYGKYVEPYDKKLGDRKLISLSGGYSQFLENMDSLTYTLAYAYLQEDEGEINGHTDTTTGMEKRSLTGTLAYSTLDRNWIVKMSYNHAIQQDGYGENFPVTDTITVGVSHVFR